MVLEILILDLSLTVCEVRGHPTGNDRNNNSNDITTTDSTTRSSNHGKKSGSRSGNSRDLKKNGSNGECGTGCLDPGLKKLLGIDSVIRGLLFKPILTMIFQQ